MALLKYDELVKIDVTPFCDTRDAKDDNGKTIKVPYLNWAKCIELLHQHGAETVYYTPLKTPEGSYLFESKRVTSKQERTTGCYFVSVEIHIDDLVFTMDMPLLNGSLVVYDDTLNQLRISNCHARAFVKGVAIRTGLGFGLWAGETDTDNAADDLSIHNIYAIKQRLELLITQKMKKNGLSQKELCDAIGIDNKRFVRDMQAFDDIALIEKKVAAL